MFVEYGVWHRGKGDGDWVLREREGADGKKEVEEKGWERIVMHGVGDDQIVKVRSQQCKSANTGQTF